MPTAFAELTDATSPALLFPNLTGETGEAVIGELATGIADTLNGVAAHDLERGFAEREALGSTAIGAGLAIPHCKVRGMPATRMAVGLHLRGVQFGQQDGEPVRLFFAVVSPVGSSASHLRVLAAIGRWAQSPARLARMLGAHDGREMYASLTGDAGAETGS